MVKEISNGTSQKESSEHDFELYDFDAVFEAELNSVNERRDRLSNVGHAHSEHYEATFEAFTPQVSNADALDGDARDDDLEVKSIRSEASLNKAIDHSVTDLAGICISGGGIRSAAFSIGVTQAMDAISVCRKPNGRKRPQYTSAFEQMDYMSTVSGGGYTGSCITASMAEEGADFPFPSKLEKTEAPILRHIRDHSNYLFPRGGIWEKLKNLSVYLRGIFANVPSILSILLAFVLITIWFCRDIPSIYEPSIFGYTLNEIIVFFHSGLSYIYERFDVTDPVIRLPDIKDLHFDDGFFIVFQIFLFLLTVAFILWGLFRTILKRPIFEFGAHGTNLFSGLLALAVVIFFFELQPKMLSALHIQHCESLIRSGAEVRNDNQKNYIRNGDMFKKASCQKTGLVYADEVDVIGKQRANPGSDKAVEDNGSVLEAVIPKNSFYEGILSSIQKFAAILSAVAAVVATARGFLGLGEQSAQQSNSGVAAKLRGAVRQAGFLSIGLLLPLLLWLAYLNLSFWGLRGINAVHQYCHAPSLLAYNQANVCAVDGATFLPGVLYLVGFVISSALALYISTNKNSPHGLYRDSLARAFLVSGDQEKVDGVKRPVKRLDDIRMSETGRGNAPIHLINAALNILGSKQANGRGRNAGFFTFSKNHVGSSETGYLKTETAELLEVEGEQGKSTTFGLSSAMAVSAAAASTAMGSMTMKPFALTLAILNVRLGYWFKNPFRIAKEASLYGAALTNFRALNSTFGHSSIVLLIKEVMGLMDEKNELIYLTDGGHIENLGLYTLLQRRAKFIVVVDGEADPNLNFGSFVTAQRYARIDLGTRIDLEVDKIRDSMIATRQAVHGVGKGEEKVAGLGVEERTHCAVGTIYYPKDDSGKVQQGVVLYIKSSLSGDENDYISDYFRRNSTFPHETTGDQFFSEEQFEAYRALGFHSAFKALTGQSFVQYETGLVKLKGPGNKDTRFSDSHPLDEEGKAKFQKVDKLWQECFNQVKYRY